MSCIAACRSSRFFPVTRSWSPWIAPWTLSFDPFTILTISRALSVAMPCCSSIRCLAVPTGPGSIGPSCSDLSGTCRLASFSFSISPRVRILKSSAAPSSSACSSRLTVELEPLKSKRCPTSRRVWLTALSTSWRSTWQTMSKDGMRRSLRGGWTDHVDARRRNEAEGRRVELDVALLSVEADARRGPQRVADLRLFDRRVGFSHGERERSDALVLLRREPQDPAIALVAIEHRVELAIEMAEAAEERDGRRGLEGLGDGRADHLLVVGLVYPERLAVAHDRLPIGWVVVPAHPVGLLERDRTVGLERAGERGGLDGLRERGF